MISRCYDKTHPCYNLYGGKGVTVSTSWKCFENFLDDLFNIPFYSNWKLAPNEYSLDKDYFGSQQYSKTTVIFLDKEYNKLMAKMPRAFSCNGEIFVSMKECADKYNLDRRRISEILAGNLQKKSYPKLQWFDPPEGKLVRKQRIIDQIANVIKEIKANPDSRRLVVSAWNVGDLSKMALQPCHAMFQFYVQDGELSCHLFQRSCDLGLGWAFNVASYALLTHMIAQVCGLKVGEFVHTISDAHIYLDHVDKLKEQLQRKPLPMPKIELNPFAKDIDSFGFDDIKLVDYQHHPAISMKVAV
jgi:thymidylate synthase